MTYETSEKSQALGEPVELFKFIGPWKVYRYTSNAVDQDYDGTYRAMPLLRSTLEEAGLGTAPDVEIRVPFDAELVKDYAYRISPPTLILEIYRRHTPGEESLYWTGEVTAITLEGQECILTLPSRFKSLFKTPIPTIFWHSPCNWVLYDSLCGLIKGSFVFESTIASFGASQVWLDTSPPEEAGWYTAGELTINATGESRLVRVQNGNVIDVMYPFHDIRVGMAVSMQAGCDHSYATCVAKFNNGPQYGGHNWVPAWNVFRTGLGGD